MFGKNLKYFRSKKFLSQRQLAKLCNLSPMTISYYESGERLPNSIEIIENLAKALEIKVSDFLITRNNELKIIHGEFRKNDDLTKEKENHIKEIVEEYLERIYTTMSIIGGEILPKPIICKSLDISDDFEIDANKLRQHLNFSLEGPVYNLIGILENKGILICLVDIDDNNFSGINGFVNDRPYIAINKHMPEERRRSTIVHELVHLMFSTNKIKEKKIEAIMGAFLIPKEDVIRELGIKRQAITKDMCLICKEYGITMALLVMRAYQCKIITNKIKCDYFDMPKFTNLKYSELENSTLLEQLVCRAVNEHEISIQRGAELLRINYEEMKKLCCED